MTYDAVTSIGPCHADGIVAIDTIEAVYQKRVVVGITVPVVPGEGTVQPVRRVKGRATGVAIFSIIRSCKARDT
jgi:hypothetical protein